MVALKLRILASVPALSEDTARCTEMLEVASGLRLTAVEIKLGRDELIAQKMRNWLTEALATYDFKPYAHLPYLQGKANLASPDPKMGRKALGTALRSVEFAAGLGCSLVNTHLGVALGRGPHIPRAVSRLGRLSEESLKMGVEICVENQESSCGGILNTPDDVRALLACNPEIQLTYDPAHANTHGFGIREFLPAVMPRLRYLHLHDNNGRSDQHLALGRANLDFKHLMLELGRCGNASQAEMPATLELAARDLGPSIEYLGQLTVPSLQIG